MGDLRNCRRCGRLFVYAGRPICSSCMEEDEEIFKRVREYIEQYPKSTVFEVSEALDIPVSKIIQFLREGKLELSPNNTNMLLECEKCGRPISTGRYCTECASAIEKELMGRYGKARPAHIQKDKDQMFLAHRRKRK